MFDRLISNLKIKTRKSKILIIYYFGSHVVWGLSQFAFASTTEITHGAIYRSGSKLAAHSLHWFREKCFSSFFFKSIYLQIKFFFPTSLHLMASKQINLAALCWFAGVGLCLEETWPSLVLHLVPLQLAELWVPGTPELQVLSSLWSLCCSNSRTDPSNQSSWKSWIWLQTRLLPSWTPRRRWTDGLYRKTELRKASRFSVVCDAVEQRAGRAEPAGKFAFVFSFYISSSSSSEKLNEMLRRVHLW